MKVMSKLATASVTGAIAGILVLAGLASAHSNHIRVVMKGDCATGINVEAHAYPDNPEGSSVTVEFDGNVAFQQLFGPAIKHHVPNPDQSVPHLYRVTFDRFDVINDDGDKIYTGVLPACEAAPPVPSTTLVPAVSQVPTTQPEIPCVLGPDGHYNFAGTNNPCEGPATTTTVALLTPPEVPTTTVSAPPSGGLPATGFSAMQRLGLAMVVFGCGWGLIRLARRPRTS
jgi:hypothetical protein